MFVALNTVLYPSKVLQRILEFTPDPTFHFDADLDLVLVPIQVLHMFEHQIIVLEFQRGASLHCFIVLDSVI
jgi:hypothetical protein